MKNIISICIAIALLTLSVFADDVIPAPDPSGPATPLGIDGNTGTGSSGKTFGVHLFCVPEFGFDDGPQTVHLGNFFPGFTGTVNGKSIIWELTGPEFYSDGTTPIDYTVTGGQGNYEDNGVNIACFWNVEAANIHATYLGGIIQYDGTDNNFHPYVHLKQGTHGTENCNGVARFTIVSWHIVVASDAAPGMRTFDIIMTASVNI